MNEFEPLCVYFQCLILRSCTGEDGTKTDIHTTNQNSCNVTFFISYT